MSPDRWLRIEELYHAALDRQATERAVFLAAACQGDSELRKEVETLLEQQSGSLLDGPAWEQAPSLMGRQSLEPGAQLGPYRVTGALGSGGMGEVYKARDTRLGRDVAIKVLPEHLAKDTQARARFEREAKAVAALNHSHICALYDVGPDYLVMELVEGPTLAERIALGAIPLEESLEIARQIAEALEAAHEKGIIHRDLKPANIKLAPQGAVKVLDFGLATVARGPSAIFDDPDSSPTRTATLSQQGVILGTAAYMAPEQARGQVVDKRADIWAFGVILYEMLTGNRLFEGETTTEILAAVLTKDPQWQRVPTVVKPLLRSCLEKDPKRRLRDIGDVSRQLDDAVQFAAEHGRRARQWLTGIIVSGVIVAALAAAAWWLSHARGSPMQPNLRPITHDSGLTTDPALSPDAKLVAYKSDRDEPGRFDIWVQQTSSGPALRLAKDVDGAPGVAGPVFSADGSKIYFASSGPPRGIYEVSPLGGEARLIAADGFLPRVSPDGHSIAYIGSSNELCIVPTSGGSPRSVAPGYDLWLDGIGGEVFWSPDSRHIVFRGQKAGQPLTMDFWGVPAKGGTPSRTGWVQWATEHGFIRGSAMAWLTNNVLISWLTIGETTRIYRTRFDRRSWRILQEPEALTLGTTSEQWPSVAAGKLAFVSEVSTQGIWSLPADTNQGRINGLLQRITTGKASYRWASMTPDGEKLVYSSQRGVATDIYLMDMRTGAERMLVTDTREKMSPQISADGSVVVYVSSYASSLAAFKVLSSGGPAQKICDDCGFPNSLSPDGKQFLAFRTEGSRKHISVTSVESGRSTVILQHSHDDVGMPRLSNDGKWVAFQIVRSTGFALAVAPFRGDTPVPEQDWTTVTSTSDEAWKDHFWSPNGDLLYYSKGESGQMNLLAQRLDRKRHPVGEPFRVYQFYGRGSRGDSAFWGGWTAVPGRIVGVRAQLNSNIWLMDLPK